MWNLIRKCSVFHQSVACVWVSSVFWADAARQIVGIWMCVSISNCLRWNDNVPGNTVPWSLVQTQWQMWPCPPFVRGLLKNSGKKLSALLSCSLNGGMTNHTTSSRVSSDKVSVSLSVVTPHCSLSFTWFPPDWRCLLGMLLLTLPCKCLNV